MASIMAVLRAARAGRSWRRSVSARPRPATGLHQDRAARAGRGEQQRPVTVQLLLVRHPRPQRGRARHGFRGLRQHRLDRRSERHGGLPRGLPAPLSGSARPAGGGSAGRPSPHPSEGRSGPVKGALRGLCGTVAACVAGPCPCSLPRCSPRGVSPSTPHLPGPSGPRPPRSRKTSSTPSTPGPHSRTRGRRCPSPPCPSLRPRLLPAAPFPRPAVLPRRPVPHPRPARRPARLSPRGEFPTAGPKARYGAGQPHPGPPCAPPPNPSPGR